ETLSFHLGRERCSIDVPGVLFAPAELALIESRANDIVAEARPVRARFLGPGEEAALRKELPAGAGPGRGIEIGGWGTNGCCGTHVRRTSEIGLVKLGSQEKVKGGTRLYFACGARAVGECDRAMRRVEALAASLTCHPDALAEKIERLVEDAKSARKDGEAL